LRVTPWTHGGVVEAAGVLVKDGVQHRAQGPHHRLRVGAARAPVGLFRSGGGVGVGRGAGFHPELFTRGKKWPDAIGPWPL